MGNQDLLNSFLDALYNDLEIDGCVNASSISQVLQQLRVTYNRAVLSQVMEYNGFVDEHGVFAYDVDSFRDEMNTLLTFDLTKG